MKHLSVCSGIEAASVAWQPLGFQAVAFAEVERFPSAVLAHHYPDVPNRGDITRFKDWPDATFDVLVGGTPCQSFSVAGLRAGLADPRGNLALTYLAVADRYRPCWLVWENVPGALSVDDGRALGAFLGGLSALGYGWAYRSLDAQYFGLAQRRRRVFVVGHLGDWRRAAAVLFERESLSGHPAPRREAGERLADSLTVGANQCLGRPWDFVEASTGEISHCLNAGGMGRIDYESETLIAHALRADGFDASEDGTERGTPIVPIAFDPRQIHHPANYSNPKAGDPCHPLRAVANCAPAIAFDNRLGETSDTAITMRAQSHGALPMAQHGMQVRRLTPRECERLQGFQDDYTLIPYRGKPAADGPRYKALGNSMAVPVMAWIGKRLALMDSIRQALPLEHV